MLRMEIALLLVTAFVAYVYFAAEKEPSSLHRTFSLLLVMVLAFLALAELCNFLLPLTYTQTPEGNYSSGPYMLVPYGAVAFYLVLCAALLVMNGRRIHRKQRSAIGAALGIEFVVCAPGAAPHLAHQRHGHHSDDPVVLSHAGKSRGPAGPAGGAEALYALSEEPGQPAFSL